MSNRAGNKGLVVRLAFILVLGAAAIVLVKSLKSPLAIQESEVRRLVKDNELIGLSLDEAAEMLQHEAPPTTNGIVVFDFKQVKGWQGPSVCLDVKDGKVVAATWLKGDVVPEDDGGK